MALFCKKFIQEYFLITNGRYHNEELRLLNCNSEAELIYTDISIFIECYVNKILKHLTIKEVKIQN